MANGQTVSYPPASGRLLVGSIISFISGLFILISFSAPYWLESFAETYQSFVRMGLWEVCFRNFQYPENQYAKKFNGCHYLFSEAYLIIREWLQPGWLMFVQAMMCMSLIFSFTSLCLLAVVLMRYFVKYEVFIIGSAFILQIMTAIPAFLAVAVFGARCQDRTWFMYPLYNHPSWAYALAVIAFFFSSFAALLLYQEMKMSWERKRTANRLVTESTPYRY